MSLRSRLAKLGGISSPDGHCKGWYPLARNRCEQATSIKRSHRLTEVGVMSEDPAERPDDYEDGWLSMGAQNLRSLRDSGDVEYAPITLLFGKK
jgi:hypothetical protein